MANSTGCVHDPADTGTACRHCSATVPMIHFQTQLIDDDEIAEVKVEMIFKPGFGNDGLSRARLVRAVEKFLAKQVEARLILGPKDF